MTLYFSCNDDFALNNNLSNLSNSSFMKYFSSYTYKYGVRYFPHANSDDYFNNYHVELYEGSYMYYDERTVYSNCFMLKSDYEKYAQKVLGDDSVTETNDSGDSWNAMAPIIGSIIAVAVYILMIICIIFTARWKQGPKALVIVTLILIAPIGIILFLCFCRKGRKDPKAL